MAGPRCPREPRSGDRNLAWGVSPRNQDVKKGTSPEGATELASTEIIP